MTNLNNNADTNNKIDSSLYHIQQIAKLVAGLDLSKFEREAFLDQIFEEAWAERFNNTKIEATDDVKSDCCAKSHDCSHNYHKSKEIEENEHLNFKLNCALLSIDQLFHTTTADLLKFSFAELEEKRRNALVLVRCLESVVNLKKHREAQ